MPCLPLKNPGKDAVKESGITPEEKQYIEAVEAVIEQFGTIQRNFVLDRQGIRAIVRFIQDLEGKHPVFALDDPVLQKGKGAAERVIQELAHQLKTLEALTPPQIWARFHSAFLDSIRLQLEGYREMMKVFNDNRIEHIAKGQEKVDRGMSILSAGGEVSEQ